MLIVMIWHFSNDVEGQWIYSILTAPVMIPLFFAITGYVFNSCDGNSKKFYRKLFYHLVIPWLLLAIIKGGCIALIRQSLSYYSEFLLNLFTGENLWYFPCCIIAEILHFHILKFSKRDVLEVVLLSLSMVVAGFAMSKFAIFHFLNISTAFICQFFLLLGYLARIVKLESLKPKTVNRLFLLAFFIYACVCSFLIFIPPNSPNQIALDVHLDKYYCGIPLAFIIITFGLLMLYVMFSKITQYPQFLKFIGKNTIVFYIFHYDTLTPLEILLAKLNIDIIGGWIGVALALIWSIAICLILSAVLNKFFPFLVGKVKHAY